MKNRLKIKSKMKIK